MADTSEFESARRHSGYPCWFARLDLPPDKMESLEAAMAAKHITTMQITRTINEWGIVIGDNMVRKHRNGDCSCQT